MKGLKIIPLFLLLIVFSYLGTLFVQANNEPITVQFGNFQTGPTPVGFIVLTSMLVGMIVAGFLCSIELLALYVQNRRLKRRLPTAEDRLESDREMGSRTSGRFS